jgi:predicted aspartyl protease
MWRGVSGRVEDGMTRQLWFVSLTLLASSSVLAQQPRTTELKAVSDTGAIDKTSQTEDVRFRTEQNDRLTVPVRLSGTGPYRFMVDTGSDRTAVSRELAAKLKLQAGDSALVHGVAGALQVATASVPDLQLTRKQVKVIDAPLLESANIGADGILGVDSLRSQRIMFDFEAHTLSIVPSAVPDFREEPGTIVVQGRRRNGRLIVTEATANDQSVTVVVDTGSQVTVGNEALRRALTKRKLLSGALQQVELESVTGQKIAGDYMFVRELKIGGIELKGLAIVFADAHTFKQLNLNDKPALLLGMNAMRAFKKVSIDFANRRLRVIVPEQSSLDTRMAAAGLN